MEIGIVADDLTGAADSLAPFARRGYHAGVGFELKHSVERFLLDKGDVLAYDTGTREIGREQRNGVQTTVRRAARRLAGLGPRVVFKKIDSTLRGHLRAELDAMRAEFGGRLALICPAFPAQGRTVQTGVLHIHNVPWTSTEFAPSGMFASLTVRGAFGMDGDAAAAEIGIGDMRQGVAVLEARLLQLRAQGVETVFCDASLPEDLLALAQVILRNPEQILPVGSAGLARALAETLPSPPAPAPSLEKLVQPFVNGRVLVIVGSLHAASRRQAALLAERLGSPPIVIDGAGDFKRHVESAVDQIKARYASGQQVALLTTPDAPEAGFAEGFSWLPGSVARRACLWGLRANCRIDGLIVSGGDTAKELCLACGGTGLRIEGEWQPGVAVTSLNAEPDAVDNISFAGLPMITKAGGFGDDLTLARCVGLL
jgi:D-threonate/D-erythronate kinase